MFSVHLRMTHATFRRSHRPVIEAHQRREERKKKKSLANERKSDSVTKTFTVESKHVGDVQQLKKKKRLTCGVSLAGPWMPAEERGKRSNHGFIRRTRRHGSASHSNLSKLSRVQH